MNDPQRPAKPFYFRSSAHLLRVVGESATNLAEFLPALKSCPESSIFQHTFQTLEEHHFIGEGFSNDFAHWAFASCDEPGLAERLASVDVREFTSVADLRGRIVHVVEEHVNRNPRAAERTARAPFYFCASDTTILPTTFAANDLAEFVDALGRVSVHSVHHHFIEARLRLKLTSNDFSLWLEDEQGRGDLGRRINNIDIYTSTLEEVRGQIIRIVQRAIA